MSIRRTPLSFEGQFTQVPNAWLRDARLSRRARGLLAEILSHQQGWVISVHSLWKSGTEGREAVRKAIVELATIGYLERDQEHGEHGRFGEMNYRLSNPDPFTVAQKLGDGTETGARSTVAQKMTPKNTIREEHQSQGGADAPTPAPSPICPRHPDGTDGPCTACKKARLAWEGTLVAAARSDVWQPVRPAVKHIDGLCDAHRQPESTCEMCTYEAREAIQRQFGSIA